MFSHFFFCNLHFFPQFPGGRPQHAGTEGGDLDQRIRGGDPDGIVIADLGGQGFNILVAGFSFFGVDYLDVVELALFTQVALLLVAVENQNDPVLLKARKAAEGVHQLPSGSIQIVFRGFRQILPGKDHVIAVHDDALLFQWTDGQLFRGGTVAGIPVLGPFDGAEFPFHNGFQFLAVDGQVPGDDLGLFFLFQAAFQMHIIGHLIPLHGETGAVGAEDGVRRVFHIRFRVVAKGFRYCFLVMTGQISPEGQLQPAATLGVGSNLIRVIAQFRGRNQSFQNGHGTNSFRRVKIAAHGSDIGDGTTHHFRGQGQGEIIPGFQQNGFCLHQTLTDSPVSGLAEVAAFGVL